MSTRRLAVIGNIPPLVKKIFSEAGEPVSAVERLWRERAARMILDALGHTNLTVKPVHHNDAVRYARRWLKQVYAYHDNPRQQDDAEATFDAAGIDGYHSIRDVVLAIPPILFADQNEIEDEA